MNGPSSERTDAQLVAAVLGGERSAYRTLVERYEDVLFQRARALLKEPEPAADAVQDTFVRAYQRLAECSDPDRFGGWVYRMLRNACLDELRAARRRTAPLTPNTARADADPHADLERLEIRQAIAEALTSLSPVLREAFVLKHVEGLAYDEMQRITGVSRSALKMRVKRAREELEVALEPFAAADDVTQSAPDPSYRLHSPEPRAERGHS